MLSQAARELLDRIAHLNVDRSGGQRKPHKPLLILLAIAELRRGRTSLSLAEIYIRWHRDPGRGGVFREPALPL